MPIVVISMYDQVPEENLVAMPRKIVGLSASKSEDNIPIWPKFELNRGFSPCLIIYKFL